MFSCFSEIAKLFSRVAVSLCLPINPHIEYKRSISLQPCQQFLLSFWFFNCSNVQWFLLVVLICLSLMAYNVRHFYVLFAKHISSLLAVSSCLLPIARKKKTKPYNCVTSLNFEFFIYSSYKPYFRLGVCKYIFPVCDFHWCMCIFPPTLHSLDYCCCRSIKLG